MKLLDLTLDLPSLNLALDEALLDCAESHPESAEILRFWESPQTMVVLGRASRVEREVDTRACRTAGAAILRRCSGGTTVVAGPGCLMYALLLSYRRRPQLRTLAHAHSVVMRVMQRALVCLVPGVRYKGTSDLTWEDRKISGNSVRCRREFLLYHGTVLYDFPLGTIGRLLRTPPRQPDYRKGRSHEEFLANLPAPANAIKRALANAWNADEHLDDWPRAETDRLARDRYEQESWNLRL